MTVHLGAAPAPHRWRNTEPSTLMNRERTAMCSAGRSSTSRADRFHCNKYNAPHCGRPSVAPEFRCYWEAQPEISILFGGAVCSVILPMHSLHYSACLAVGSSSGSARIPARSAWGVVDLAAQRHSRWPAMQDVALQPRIAGSLVCLLRDQFDSQPMRADGRACSLRAWIEIARGGRISLSVQRGPFAKLDFVLLPWARLRQLRLNNLCMRTDDVLPGGGAGLERVSIVDDAGDIDLSAHPADIDRGERIVGIVEPDDLAGYP